MTTVPYGYLISIAILALPALRLPRLPTWLGTAVLLNELPVLASAAFAASTLLAYADGDLVSPVTLVAAGLAAVCMIMWIGRGVQTRQVLREAMGTAEFSQRLPLRRILLCPIAVRPRSVERLRDLSYGPFGKRNRLDLYRRRDLTTGAPILVHHHGGHYRTGHKSSQSLPMLHTLADRGYVCISANYRLREATCFEDHLIDAKRLVAWIREHGHKWGGDPSRIVLSGTSAGAHLAMMAAFTVGERALQPGFEDVDTSVSAVVILSGYYGRYSGDRPETSPTDSAHVGSPPVLIAHGDHDSAVPVLNARRFADRLRAVSKETVVYAELPGGQHGFDRFYSPRFAAVVNAIQAFVEQSFVTRHAS